jgi:sterol 14-demethylase
MLPEGAVSITADYIVQRRLFLLAYMKTTVLPGWRIALYSVQATTNMELTSSSAMWLAMAILAITAALTKIALGGGRRRCLSESSDLTCKTPPPPPVVNCIALLGLLPALFRGDVPATMQQLYAKFGSVFTVSVAGLLKATFLVGPEVSAHFFQGLESEVSHGDLFEFTVPMFGKEVGHGVDNATRIEQGRFFAEALKPVRLRIHVDPMVQEVEVSNSVIVISKCYDYVCLQI